MNAEKEMNLTYTKQDSIEKIKQIVTERKFSKYYKHGSFGLYFLWGQNDTLLYIGWASNMPTRLTGHLTGNTNTSYFSDHIKSVSTIEDSDFKNLEHRMLPRLGEDQDIEHFLIEKMRPIFNKFAYEVTDGSTDCAIEMPVADIIRWTEVANQKGVSLSQLVCGAMNDAYCDDNPPTQQRLNEVG